MPKAYRWGPTVQIIGQCWANIQKLCITLCKNRTVSSPTPPYERGRVKDQHYNFYKHREQSARNGRMCEKTA